MACSPTIRTLTLHGSAKASLTARTSDFSQGRCIATHGLGGGKLRTSRFGFRFSEFFSVVVCQDSIDFKCLADGVRC